ncbi:T9SS type A sorting domain-containing protein [Croceiramulus getboli]|nr:T9SS type A sorting domain-containing protein [Flavobacteriaceae bacterium YJPT1-3]
MITHIHATSLGRSTSSKVVSLLLFFLLSSQLHLGQTISSSVVANAGTTLENGDPSLAFTLGEPLVGLVTNNESVAQGFWSGAGAGSTLRLEVLPETITLLAYPNPVTDQLTIQLDRAQAFDAHLFNVVGKQVLQADFTQQEQQLDMSSLTNGVYLLQLRFRESGLLKTFKIIKN